MRILSWVIVIVAIIFLSLIISVLAKFFLYISVIIEIPLFLVGILLLCVLPEYLRSWRMCRLAKELSCSFHRREKKVKTFLSIPFEGRRNIIQGLWHGEEVLIFDIRRFADPAPKGSLARAWYILGLDYELQIFETSINAVTYKHPKSLIDWYPPISLIKDVLSKIK